MNQTHPIVFFDGVCGLCNGFVDFLLRVDRSHKLRFATLQGTSAWTLLPAHIAPQTIGLETVVFLNKDGRAQERSDAIIAIFETLGGVYSLARAARLLPALLRDGVYRWVARNRYGWFGKKETCRIPTKEERQFFLE